MTDAPLIFPLQKYKGQPVEVLRGDPDYVRWLQGQDWFRERYPEINTYIINNFGAPAETPEHNALQARFLDDGFCRALLVVLDWEAVTRPQTLIRREMNEWPIPRRREIADRCAREVERIRRSVEDTQKSIARGEAAELELGPVVIKQEQARKRILDLAGEELWNKNERGILHALSSRIPPIFSPPFYRSQSSTTQAADTAAWSWLKQNTQDPLVSAWVTEKECAKQIREHEGGLWFKWLAGNRESLPEHLTQLTKAEAAHAQAAADAEAAEGYAEQPPETMNITITREFEVGGWDVIVRAEACDESYRDEVRTKHAVTIELKPSLGDDYPAVLRQMKANRGAGSDWQQSAVLVFDRFAASGASLDQVKAIFKASGFQVLALAEIEGPA